MDIDRRLHEAGQRWRESQGPALQPPSAASLREAAPPHKWRKGLAPMAAAAAVAAIIFGFVSVHGATTGSRPLPAGSVTTPAPSVSSPSTEPSTSAARAAAAAVAAAEAARQRAVAEAEIARRLPQGDLAAGRRLCCFSTASFPRERRSGSRDRHHSNPSPKRQRRALLSRRSPAASGRHSLWNQQSSDLPGRFGHGISESGRARKCGTRQRGRILGDIRAERLPKRYTLCPAGNRAVA